MSTLFRQSQLHAINKESQIPPYDLSYAFSYRFAAPKLSIEELFHVKRLFVFEHKIDRPAQFVGKDAQRFAFVVFAGELWHVIFGLGRVSEH